MISPTDLIINKQGRAYHLDLAPADIPDWIITVGDPQRVHLVSRYFDKIELKQKHREFITHTGLLGTKRILVISTGIGSDNIDIVFNELDALVNIDFTSSAIHKKKRKLKIIRLGTSGTIQPHIPVDSLLINVGAIGLDNLMNFYANDKLAVPTEIIGQARSKTKSLLKNAYWAKAAASLVSSFRNPAVYEGIGITSPGFYGPQGRSLRLQSTQFDIQSLAVLRYKKWKLTNIEMETAAIYALAAALGHQAISINVILANRIINKFSTQVSKSIDHLIRTTLDKLDVL